MKFAADRSVLVRCLIACLCALGLATALAQVGGLGWLPELTTHFRPQYLTASIVTMVALLALRRPRLALLAAAVAGVNGWYVGPFLVPLVMPGARAAAPQSSISVIAFNLWYRNGHPVQVRRYLESRAPDVLVLSELTPQWVTELRPVTSKYPYWLSMDRQTPWGLGLFSRYPLRDSHATDLGVQGSVNVMATVELPGGDVDVVAVHLSSPLTPQRAATRNAQLAVLAQMLGRESRGRPRVVLGDLNVTPFSPVYAEFLGRTGLEDTRRPLGLLGTWPAWMPLLQVQIDHCLADPGAAVRSVVRGPALGSDHYPLEITIARPPEPRADRSVGADSSRT